MMYKNYQSDKEEKPFKRILNINNIYYIFNLSTTISELITYLGFNKNVIVIDYNGIILDKSIWELTYIRDKDSIEIFSVAGGG